MARSDFLGVLNVHEISTIYATSQLRTHAECIDGLCATCIIAKLIKFHQSDREKIFKASPALPNNQANI